MGSSSASSTDDVESVRNVFQRGSAVLRVSWSADGLATGTAEVEPGSTFVVARRMSLPELQPLVVEQLAGSTYALVRVPYVSDPALVVSATASHPVLLRGQRANGAVVELTTPAGEVTSPAPGQRLTLPVAGTRVDLRFPDWAFSLVVDFDLPTVGAPGSGTVQLGVDALQHDDTWLVAALAVALSPDHSIVAHGDLKHAFSLWRGEEISDGAFDRNVLRPALESRAIELPGPRLNKIVYLVERCRRTAEIPAHVQADLLERLQRLHHRSR